MNQRDEFRELIEHRWPVDCLTGHDLDRLWLGELSGTESVRFAVHLEKCDWCRQRLTDREEIRCDSLELRFLRTIPSSAPVEAVKNEGLPWSWLPLPAGLTAALISLVVMVVAVPFLADLKVPAPEFPKPPGISLEVAGERESGYRRKGAAHTLSLFLNRDNKVQRAQSGDVFYPGDRVRFACRSATGGHLAIYSHDPRMTSRYLPVRGRTPLKLAPGREVALEPAFELDDTLGRELVLAILCEQSFDAVKILEDLRKSRKKGIKFKPPPGCERLEFQLRKQTRKETR